MSDQQRCPKQQNSVAGPPALWSEWPRTLERAARVRGARARARPRSSRCAAAVSRALKRWSARIEREPVRVYGLGAALAFAFGVLIGLF